MKKQVYKVNDSNRTVRMGTHDIVSGALIAPETRPEAIVHGPFANGGGEVYALKHSLRVRPYGTNPFKEYLGEGFYVLGKLSQSGFCWAPEYESQRLGDERERLEVFARCGMLPTADCTVAVEYLGLPRATLHAARAVAQNLQRTVGCVEDNCGTHCNYSTDEMRADLERGYRSRLASAYSEVFMPLLRRLRSGGASERIAVFGSDWRGYASPTTEWRRHDCFMGLRQEAFGDGRNCIEFRLPRARTPEHLERSVFLCKEWSIEIDKFLAGKQTAEEAGAAIVHQYELAVDGQARWQKRVK